MITVVGGNKGGGSKSTTAVNICVGLALRGNDVCYLDADKQSSGAKWIGYREEAGIEPRITLVQRYDNLAPTLRQLNDKYDHIIVDVPGRNSREMLTAGSVADLIICPSLCSQFDLDTLTELETQLEAWRDINPDLILHMYHTRATTNPILRGRERHDYLTFLEDFPTLKPLNSVNSERTPYRTAIPMGLGVLELNTKAAQAAADEVTQLIEEVYAPWL
ncbi:AAA family ATPase [Salmonella enterica]|nr:AAA family ATPase [Salmonella enterica]